MAFENKPAFEDIAVNPHLTGTAPVFCIPLISAAADAGLANIGTGSTANDASYTSDSDPISYSTVEGGGVDLDMADNQVLKQPIPASAVTRTAGSLHWRLKLPATMPVDAEYFYFASSGRSTGAAAGAGQYNLRVNATDVVMQFRSSTDSAPGVEYSVAHSASGAAAGGTIDVHFVWGSGGVRLYVNGVASAQNNPSNTGSVIIRAAAQGGAGEDFGDSVVGGGVGLDITFVALDWVLWGQELSTVQLASHREDPHWPMRHVLQFDSPVPQLSVESDEDELSMWFTASANAPAISYTPIGDNLDGGGGTEATGGDETFPTELKSVLTFVDRSLLTEVQIQYRYPDGGDSPYYYYATSATTGKAGGERLSVAIPGSRSIVRLGAFSDIHGNKAATYTDHIGDAGGLAGTGIGPTNQTEAQYDVAINDIFSGIIAKDCDLHIDCGDVIQDGGGYAGTSEAASNAVDRVRRNKYSDLFEANVPFVSLIGNHDAVESLSAVDATTVGERRRIALAYRGNPPGDAGAQMRDWGPFSYGSVDFFMMNAYVDVATLGDTSFSDQITALDTWARASTAQFKVILSHGRAGNGRGGVLTVDSDFTAIHAIAVANGITAVMWGHDHAAYHIVLDGVHYIEIPGVPWHIRTNVGGDDASYAGALFFEQMWGYAILDFRPSGFSFRFYRVGRWTWDGTIDAGQEAGVEVLGLNQLAYTWPNRGGGAMRIDALRPQKLRA